MFTLKLFAVGEIPRITVGRHGEVYEFTLLQHRPTIKQSIIMLSCVI